MLHITTVNVAICFDDIACDKALFSETPLFTPKTTILIFIYRVNFVQMAANAFPTRYKYCLILKYPIHVRAVSLGRCSHKGIMFPNHTLYLSEEQEKK